LRLKICYFLRSLHFHLYCQEFHQKLHYLRNNYFKMFSDENSFILKRLLDKIRRRRKNKIIYSIFWTFLNLFIFIKMRNLATIYFQCLYKFLHRYPELYQFFDNNSILHILCRTFSNKYLTFYIPTTHNSLGILSCIRMSFLPMKLAVHEVYC
jgi:hypothetical protein